MRKNGQTACQTVLISNRLGLHARAAGKLVNTVDQFDAIVVIEKNQQSAQANSVLELMMLTAGPGDHISIKAEGPEAEAALKAIVNLIENRFDED
jgi:phosphotransferase system HPr (HPr) family protein